MLYHACSVGNVCVRRPPLACLVPTLAALYKPLCVSLRLFFSSNRNPQTLHLHSPPTPCDSHTQAVFAQGSASTVGILLRSWHQGGEGGAAVLFNWETCLLEVVFEALDPATMTFSLTAPLARRIGGNITHKPGAPLALRLLLDGRWGFDSPSLRPCSELSKP